MIFFYSSKTNSDFETRHLWTVCKVSVFSAPAKLPALTNYMKDPSVGHLTLTRCQIDRPEMTLFKIWICQRGLIYFMIILHLATLEADYGAMHCIALCILAHGVEGGKDYFWMNKQIDKMLNIQ